MAYTHSKYEVQMAPVIVSGAPTSYEGVDLGATGVVARWTPGLVPHIIKGAAVMSFATTAAANAAHFSFRADLSTPGTPTQILKIVQPTTRVAHTAMYVRPTYYIEVKPGSVVQLNVTAAADAGDKGQVVLYVEPRWEEPGNITGMLLTT